MVWSRAPTRLQKFQARGGNAANLKCVRRVRWGGRAQQGETSVPPPIFYGQFFISADKSHLSPLPLLHAGNNVQRHPLNRKYVGKAHRIVKIVIAAQRAAIQAGKFNHPTVTRLGGYTA